MPGVSRFYSRALGSSVPLQILGCCAWGVTILFTGARKLCKRRTASRVCLSTGERLRRAPTSFPLLMAVEIPLQILGCCAWGVTILFTGARKLCKRRTASRVCLSTGERLRRAPTSFPLLMAVEIPLQILGCCAWGVTILFTGARKLCKRRTASRVCLSTGERLRRAPSGLRLLRCC